MPGTVHDSTELHRNLECNQSRCVDDHAALRVISKLPCVHDTPSMSTTSGREETTMEIASNCDIALETTMEIANNDDGLCPIRSIHYS